MYSLNDFIREATTQLSAYNTQRNNLQSLVDQNIDRKKEFAERLTTMYQTLGSVFLPTMQSEPIVALSASLHLPRIVKLWKEKESRSVELQLQLQTLEQNETFKNRNALLAPKTGVLSAQIDELSPLYNTVNEEFKTLSAMPRLQQLLESGYGTKRYPHQGFFRFFSKNYLDDWKYADIIQEKYGKQDFVEIASRYYELRNQVETLKESLNDLYEKKNTVEAIVAKHQEYLDEYYMLDDKIISDIGRELAIHIQANPTLIDTIHPDATNVRALITTIDGIQHQQEYLDSINTKILDDITALNQRADNLRQEKSRYDNDLYRFRNKSFTQEQFSHRFGNDRYERMHKRYQNAGDTVYVFNDYSRASMVQDFLWWDIITNGRVSGAFIPQVNDYYTSHPNYSFERESLTDRSDNQTESTEWSDVS